MKRAFAYITIILLIASIYHDLSLETGNVYLPNDIPIEQDEEYAIYKVKIQAGDTVLSIVEELNESRGNFSMEKIMHDFSSLNPGSDPYELQVEQFYYFPVYIKGD